MNTIKLFDDINQCCACGSCIIVCPKNAIKFEADKTGFYYPKIDEQLCIGCGQCKKVCAYQNDLVSMKAPRIAYAAQTKNTDYKKSASGGVFASIATNFIKADGVVYGAVLEESKGRLSCFITKAQSLKELDRLFGSKYIHANMGNVYKSIKDDLSHGKRVLFAGTPCQVAALKSFLKNDYQNLFLIDIICHGVPEETWFQDYIETIEKRKNIKIRKFVFRDKKRGWGLHGRYDYVDKKGDLQKVFFISRESSYYYYFLTGSIYRTNCYSCKYACSQRVGDITIGDFWGIETEHSEDLKKATYDSTKGNSCLLVNTPNGEALVEQFGGDLATIPSTFKKIAKHNEQLNKPSSACFDRAELLDIYSKYGYKKIDETFNRRMFIKAKIYKAVQALKRMSRHSR